ncbi:Deoxyribonuclease V [Gracilaria domingensis]|nr:Deoxyribonuclease V [Gracilaria domingensis]
MSVHSESDAPFKALVSSWVTTQEQIAKKVDCSDDNNSWSHFFTSERFQADRDLFVAGADVSFSTTEDLAIGTVTVVKLCPDASHKLVFSKSCEVSMGQPYVPTFLGFREAPVVSTLLNQLPDVVRRCIDCLLVDGNGLLHPRKAGLACHVGVEEDIPCVGVSKTLLCVDGLDEKTIRQQAAVGGPHGVDVVGQSGFLWGKAIMTGHAQRKPIYVSVGHRVGLSTCAKLVQTLCDYRVPAPVRYADLHSRAFIRGERNDLFKKEEFISSGS